MIYKNKVVIKPLTKEILDESDYREWLIDPIVTLYNSHGIYYTSEKDIEEFIEKANNEYNITWAILVIPKGHIGNIALQNIDYINRSAELAILIGKNDLWRYGFGTDACKSAMIHGFTKLNLHRVWLGTIELNKGMQRIAEKLNMTQEGRLKEAFWFQNRYVDILRYSITENEWRKNEEKRV